MKSRIHASEIIEISHEYVFMSDVHAYSLKGKTALRLFPTKLPTQVITFVCRNDQQRTPHETECIGSMNSEVYFRGKDSSDWIHHLMKQGIKMMYIYMHICK